jgi:quercetin dioxygenase-like cupin family protein
MKYLRIESVADGGSLQLMVESPMMAVKVIADAPQAQISAAMVARQAVFFRLPPGWAAGWHPAPCPRLVTTTAGAVEFSTGDGQVRILRAGDVALLVDLAGRGHHTRVLDEGPWEGVSIDLGD